MEERGDPKETMSSQDFRNEPSSGPFDRRPAEAGPRAGDRGGVPDETSCTRPDLAASLAQWTELAPERRAEIGAHAEACPSCRAALELLTAVDGWLDDRLLATGGDDCPSAEDLFDFGRGPGAEALSDERFQSVAAHVASCAHCELLVDSLERRPPSPLDLEPPLPEPAPEPAPRPSALRLVGAVSALAAGVLAALFLFTETRASGPSITYPASELVLRGDSGGELLFPRERVLAGAEAGVHSALRFELAPREGATGYVVYVESHAGGAFDRGERVATLRSDESVLALTPEARAALAPGHYTWEAWAVVNGLDESMGRRDFEVVLDPATLARIERLEVRDEPERSEGILELLHTSYPSDARAYARTLPASPEREAYLARVPGR